MTLINNIFSYKKEVTHYTGDKYVYNHTVEAINYFKDSAFAYNMDIFKTVSLQPDEYLQMLLR